MKGSFCSLSGARTLIDRNFVELDCLDIHRLVVQLAGGGEAEGVDSALLADVMHEAIHHWCFDTPVGVSLALLHEQLMEATFSESDADRLAGLYVRYTCVVEMLRPMIEGLALFAEFDVVPGHGNVRAAPLAWLAALAHPGSHANGEARAIDDAIESTIARLRRVEKTASRKDNLLCQPLDPRSRGGYLTGYMIVKGMWQRMLAHTQVEPDAELWLTFVRAWVFHDTELASQLLQISALSEIDENEDVDPGVRFGARLNALLDPESSASVLLAFNNCYAPDLLATVDGRDDSRRRAQAALDLTAESVEHFGRSLDAHLDRLTQPAEHEWVSISRRLTWHASQTRGWICVASTPGHLWYLNNGALQFQADSGPLEMLNPSPSPSKPVEILCPAKPGEPWNGAHKRTATYEFWIGLNGQEALFVLVSSAGAHDYSILRSGAESERESFLSNVVSNRDAIAMHTWLNESVDIGTEMRIPATIKNSVSDYLARVLDYQADIAVGVYGGGAVAKAALWENGFFGIFRDSDLIRKANALTLHRTVYSESTNKIDPDVVEMIGTMIAVDGARCGLVLVDPLTNEILI